MSYENQLLFYKETLKHARNKKYVFTYKAAKFLYGLLQRASMIHTVVNYILLFKSIPFLPHPFLPLFHQGKGT